LHPVSACAILLPELIVACAEVLRARGEPSAARAFVAEIGGQFPRHRAFQDELKRAVQGMERAFR